MALVSSAKNTATKSAPAIMRQTANAISHGCSWLKLKSPYPTVVMVSTVKYSATSELMWCPDSS
jgi:hypothetical protein